MNEVGCQPKHWKVDSQLPYCYTEQQYYKVEKLAKNFEEALPPCRSIERLIASGTGMDIQCKRHDNTLKILFHFREPVYKEIQVIRAYTIQSLVGNAGTINIHIAYSLSRYLRLYKVDFVYNRIQVILK